MKRFLTLGLAIAALLGVPGCTIVLPGAATETAAANPSQELSQDEAETIEAAAACDAIYASLYGEGGALVPVDNFSMVVAAYSEAARVAANTSLLSEFGPVLQNQAAHWANVDAGLLAAADESLQADFMGELAALDGQVRDSLLDSCDEIVG